MKLIKEYLNDEFVVKKWSFWPRRQIIAPFGDIWFIRTDLFCTPWFSVALHDIFFVDDGKYPHDHPFNFISVILRGGYEEKFWKDPAKPDNFVVRAWNRFSIHKFNVDSAHLVYLVKPRTRTLLMYSKMHRDDVRLWKNGSIMDVPIMSRETVNYLKNA